MKEYTEYTMSFTFIIAVIVIAIAYMFGKTDNVEFQKQLLEYIGTIVTFVFGAGAGAAIGASIGYKRGKIAARQENKS